MLASKMGFKDIVKYLIEKGAEVEFTDLEGKTALILASRRGHTDIIKLLLRAGANINAADDDGWTALMQVSWAGYFDTVKALVEAGANVNQADNWGRTALMRAAIGGNSDIVEYLIENGADVNARDNEGGTALDYASKQIRDILRKAGEQESTMTPSHSHDLYDALTCSNDSCYTKALQEMINTLEREGFQVIPIPENQGFRITPDDLKIKNFAEGNEKTYIIQTQRDGNWRRVGIVNLPYPPQQAAAILLKSFNQPIRISEMGTKEWYYAEPLKSTTKALPPRKIP